MNSLTFFIFFIPILSFVLLIINFLLATHKPNKDKDSQFECGFSSFVQMSRMAFTISFFIYGLLFLLFDLEILLVYPYVVSSYNNDIYGLIIMILFFILLTVGFVYEIGNKALQIDTRQTLNLFTSSSNNLTKQSKFNINNKWLRNLFKRFYKYFIKVRNFFSKLPYKIIMIVVVISFIRFTTQKHVCAFLEAYHQGWLIYSYYFLWGMVTIFLIYWVKKTKISFKDCLILQTRRSFKALVLYWLLSILFLYKNPFEILSILLPFMFHVHHCAGPPWHFSHEAMSQLNRGYVHPRDTMKIGNLINYAENGGANQPVLREIVENLKRAGYYGLGWTYNNPHIPDIVRLYLKDHLKEFNPKTYEESFKRGEFLYSKPRITESLIRDLKTRK